MPVYQFNGTATTSPTTVTFNGDTSDTVFVQNADPGTGSILVSFDGGNNFKTLANMWDFISLTANLDSFIIKTSAGSKLYESIITA